MAHFNGDKKYGNKGGKKFGGSDSGPRSYFGGKDSGKPAMHKTTCDECGKTCEVPFKPMGSKPVYCRECFQSDNDFSDRKETRGSDKSFGHGKSFGGNKSYSSNKNYSSNNSYKPAYKPAPDQSKQQLEIMNVKLDKIMKMLSSVLTANSSQAQTMVQNEPMEAVVKIEAAEKPKKRTRKE